MPPGFMGGRGRDLEGARCRTLTLRLPEGLAEDLTGSLEMVTFPSVHWEASRTRLGFHWDAPLAPLGLPLPAPLGPPCCRCDPVGSTQPGHGAEGSLAPGSHPRTWWLNPISFKVLTGAVGMNKENLWEWSHPPLWRQGPSGTVISVSP